MAREAYPALKCGSLSAFSCVSKGPSQLSRCCELCPRTISRQWMSLTHTNVRRLSVPSSCGRDDSRAPIALASLFSPVEEHALLRLCNSALPSLMDVCASELLLLSIVLRVRRHAERLIADSQPVAASCRVSCRAQPASALVEHSSCGTNRLAFVHRSSASQTALRALRRRAHLHQQPRLSFPDVVTRPSSSVTLSSPASP